jgi:hypothetical protein
MNIEIRPDGTFSQQDAGDVGFPPVVQGRWKFLDRRGLIVANTYQQPDGYPIRMSRSGEHEDIVVKVENWMDGTPLPGARVRLFHLGIADENDCPESQPASDTDPKGIARFRGCSCRRRHLIAAFGLGAEAHWEIQDPAMNEITVKVDPMAAYFITNAIWLISDGKLYIFDDKYPLERKK